MFDWLRELIASDEQPLLEKFNVVDPSAVGEKVRSITVALTPATPDSPTSVVSLYWTDSNTKAYEKQFTDSQVSQDLFNSMKADLHEVAELTRTEKLPEASALMDALLKRYEVHTDSLIDGDPEPITTTMASRKQADEHRPNPLLSTEEQTNIIVGSPEWLDKTLQQLQSDYTTASFVPDHGDILLDLKSIAENESNDTLTLDSIKEALKEYHSWKLQQKHSTLNKLAKITFQNIFFSTPEEAVAYNEQMKKLNPPSPDVNKTLPKVDMNEPAPGEEAPLGDEDEISAPSLSYEDFEKNKADEQKMLTKRIEREVQDQVESALEKKIATKFSSNDEELVDAMRGVGRTWEEIADYMIKELKYKKEDVAMFLDQFKNSPNPLLNPNAPKDTPVKEEEPILDDKLPEAPKPPEELVSPETHDMLVDEVTEIPKKEMMEIAKLDEEITKKAADPLETTPQTPIGTDNADLGGADVTDQMLEDPTEPPVAMDMEDPQDALAETFHPNDHVYVIGDYQTNTVGFGGKFVSQYKADGETYVVIEKDNGEVVDKIPLRNVKKASYTFVLNKLAARKQEKLQKEVSAITAELAVLNSELTAIANGEPEMCKECGDDVSQTTYDANNGRCASCATVKKEAAPFEQPAPVTAPTPETSTPVEPPVKFKPQEKAPDHTKDQDVITPTPELAQMFRELNEFTAKINEMNSAVKTFIAQIEAEKQHRLKEFETTVQPEKLKLKQEELVQKIATVVKALQAKTNEVAIDANEFVFRLREEVKVDPKRVSDKELLAKVIAKFEGAQAFVDSVINGAKSQDVKTKEWTLYRSPKPKPKQPKPRKSMQMLSRRDVVAGALDTLSGMYEDLVSAFKLLLEVDNIMQPAEATANMEIADEVAS